MVGVFVSSAFVIAGVSKFHRKACGNRVVRTAAGRYLQRMLSPASPRDRAAGAPVWSASGFQLGLRLALPVLPGLIAFGIATGAVAARKGFSLLDSVVMNLSVYAGASQLVAMEVWPEQLTLATVAGLMLVTAVVNARLLLMTASLQPWLGLLPAWQAYPLMQLVVDPVWLMALRARAEGRSDASILLGAGGIFFLVWQAATTLGFLAGTLVTDLHRFGLDLVMPIFFAVMLVPLWRGPRRAVPWAIAGAVALLVQQLVGGWWFIVAGAVAGSVAGAFIDDAG
jgi:predicted branched-subunit amino acid permease